MLWSINFIFYFIYFEFNWIKIKINKIKIKYNAWMDLWILKHVMNTFVCENLGPIAQNHKFAQFGIHAFYQNFSTCNGHNSLNFYLLKVILNFFESSRCPVQPLFLSFLLLKTLSWLSFLDKKYLFVDFWNDL